MEIKTKYQYTYFIYPYVVEENKYEKHLYKLLTNKHCKLKQFNKTKEDRFFQFFLPKAREYMFWNLGYQKTKIEKLKDFDEKMQAVLLNKYPCTIFEYDILKDIQGKAGKDVGVFFNINKIEIVCFKTGICFLLIKTVLDEKSSLQEVCDFNYQFRDINTNKKKVKNNDNIKVQTDAFKNAKNIYSFIREITGNNKGARELNIDTERFITYSYASIDEKYFVDSSKKSKLEVEFRKFANIEPSNTTSHLVLSDTLEMIPNTKYGFKSNSTVLLTSDDKTKNGKLLADKYENEYLYSYIYSLHKKIYLKKINQDFKTQISFKKTREKFIHFTNHTMIEEITNDTTGADLVEEWENALNTKNAFAETKQKYDMLYKNSNIEKTAKSNKIIIIILIIIVIINIINSLNLFH